MHQPHRVLSPIMLAAAVSCAAGATAQTFPTKPIHIAAPAAGGTADVVARIVAQGLTADFQQQAIVDNRGGSFLLPIQLLLKAPPDGYTLLMIANALWTLPVLQSVPYDPLRDLAPITLAVSSPLILVVHPSLPVKTVKDLIALAKARPGELNCATGPVGGTNDIAANVFKNMAGVNLTNVAYQGAAGALTDMISGQLQVYFANFVSILPHVQSGRLRAVAVTSPEPSTLFPELPTMAAAGVPGYAADAVLGFYAPAGTPEAVIERLRQSAVRTLFRPDVKQRLLNAGAEPVGSTPAQLAATMKAEMARVARVVQETGLR